MYFPAVAPPDAPAELGVRMGSSVPVAVAMVMNFLLSTSEERDVMSSFFVSDLADSWVGTGALMLSVDEDGGVEKAWLPATAANSRDTVLSLVMVKVNRRCVKIQRRSGSGEMFDCVRLYDIFFKRE